MPIHSPIGDRVLINALLPGNLLSHLINMVGQPRECMGRGWKNVGHSSGFSPASPQNEFLESPHLIPATKPASARGLWAGATLYFSALGVGSVSLLLPCVG